MRIERIDTDEIIGLTCPKTGNRILWTDDDIEDALRGPVVLVLVTSLYPEECGFDWMPLAAAWKELKVVSDGMTCGWVTDVTYFIFIRRFHSNDDLRLQRHLNLKSRVNFSRSFTAHKEPLAALNPTTDRRTILHASAGCAVPAASVSAALHP